MVWMDWLEDKTTDDDKWVSLDEHKKALEEQAKEIINKIKSYKKLVETEYIDIDKLIDLIKQDYLNKCGEGEDA